MCTCRLRSRSRFIVLCSSVPLRLFALSRRAVDVSSLPFSCIVFVRQSVLRTVLLAALSLSYVLFTANVNSNHNKTEMLKIVPKRQSELKRLHR